jgi:hypothetical protein
MESLFTRGGGLRASMYASISSTLDNLLLKWVNDLILNVFNDLLIILSILLAECGPILLPLFFRLGRNRFQPVLLKGLPLLVKECRYLLAVFRLCFVLLSNQGLDSGLNVTVEVPNTVYMVDPRKHLLHCVHLLRVAVRNEYFGVW